MGRARVRRARLTKEQSDLVTRHAYYAAWLVGTFITARPAVRHMADDLLGAAHEALVISALRFDVARGVKFTTFCTPRVRGAIAEVLRCERAGHRLDKSAGPAVELEARHLKAVDHRAPDEVCAARQTIERLPRLPGSGGPLMAALLAGDDLTRAAARAGIRKSWASRLRDRIAAEQAA